MNEFEDIIRLLRDERPEASELELDRIKQRVRMRAVRNSRKGQFMRSRLAMLSTLVVGILLSTTGAGLAISGISSGNDAGCGQYGCQPPKDTPPQTVAPTPPSTPPTNTPGTPPSGSPLGQNDQSTTSPDSNSNQGQPQSNAQPNQVAQPSQVAQPVRQVEAGASGSQLPFTGFAAIPVLLIGAALLTTGLVLRRRQAGDRS